MANGKRPSMASLFRQFQQPRDSVESEDLGIGSDFESDRYLNHDGTFNVRKRGLRFLEGLHIYHALITMSWPRFVLLGTLAYFAITASFAGLYLACGRSAIAGSSATSWAGRFADAFFLSVQTLSTIGYGGLSPGNFAANLVVTFEAVFGLFCTALATGMVFARFSRPRPTIIFSEGAVMAPFESGRALMMRVANHTPSLLTRCEAALVMVIREGTPMAPSRRVVPLELERNRIMFLPLHWIIVHPVTEDSPLHGLSEEEFLGMDCEFFVLVSGLDETYGQTVNVRNSYIPSEVCWGAKFRPLYLPREQGEPVEVDLRRMHDTEPAELPKIG